MRAHRLGYLRYHLLSIICNLLPLPSYFLPLPSYIIPLTSSQYSYYGVVIRLARSCIRLSRISTSCISEFFFTKGPTFHPFFLYLLLFQRDSNMTPYLGSTLDSTQIPPRFPLFYSPYTTLRDQFQGWDVGGMQVESPKGFHLSQSLCTRAFREKRGNVGSLSVLHKKPRHLLDVSADNIF